MYFLQVASIICIILISLVYSVPIKFYEQIKLSCPQLNSEFQKQQFFIECTDTSRILSVKELSAKTLNDVLCLTYYNSLVKFCNNTQNSTKDLMPTLNEKDVCSNFPEIANLSNNLITSENCNKTCETFPFSKKVCSTAFYYSSRRIESKLSVPKPKQEIVTTENAMLLNNKINEEAIVNTSTKKLTETPETDMRNLKGEANNENIAPEVKQEKLIPTVNNTNITKATLPEVKEVITPNRKVKTPEPDANFKPEPTQEKVPTAKIIPPAIEKANVPNTAEMPLETKVINPTVAIDNTLFNEEVNDEQEEEERKRQELEENAEAIEDKGEKPNDSIYNDAMDGDSYFFSYFMVVCLMFVLGYVAYHNRQKLFALLLEGKRNKRSSRTRRPNSASYHKLDSNLEEAITSECSKNTSHVIY
ncbi:unnamed protein product [Brassicogethes aeneus]|uniref:Uncharacterized protein n=1 Tax=Brassicogethes aeneus TaxID=1431903 RepID=A0A9P0FL40_BRAAE|nr:unnamed protein product [Brassicogethes aeneus]